MHLNNIYFKSKNTNHVAIRLFSCLGISRVGWLDTQPGMHSSLWYYVVSQTRKWHQNSTLSTLQSTFRHSLCCYHWRHASVVLGKWSVGLAGCAGVAACMEVYRVLPGVSDRELCRGIGRLSLRWETSGLFGLLRRVTVSLVWLGGWTVKLAKTSWLLAGLPVRCHYHSGLVGVCAFPVVRSNSSALEWSVIAWGVTLNSGIGHFSTHWPRVVPGSGELRGRGMSFSCGWSVGAHGAWRPRFGLTSFKQCLNVKGAA